MHEFHKRRCIDRNGLGVDVICMFYIGFVIVAGGRIVIRIVASISWLEEETRVGVEEWILIDFRATLDSYCRIVGDVQEID